MKQDTENLFRNGAAEDGAQQPDQHIQLTLVRPPVENTEMKLDLSEVIQGLKRFLAVWLVLAVGVAGLVAGGGIFLRHTAYTGNASAIIEISLAQDALPLAEPVNVDVTRIQDAAIVQKAMIRLGLDLANLDKVRKGLSISSVLTQDQYEQQSLYKNLLSKNTANLETLQSMLDNSTQPRRHIVSLNYSELGYSRETARMLLDEILLTYRAGVEQEFNAAEQLGSIFTSMEDASWDDLETVEMDRNILARIRSYLAENIYYRKTGIRLDASLIDFDAWALENREALRSDFRSRVTGYTLEDLLSRADLLRDTDLRDLAAFVNLNLISDQEPSVLAGAWEWRLESDSRRTTELEAGYRTLAGILKDYNRTPAVYTGEESNQTTTRITSTTRTTTDNNTTVQTQITKVTSPLADQIMLASLDTYDRMVLDQLSRKEQIVEADGAVRYDRRMLERMNGAESASDETRQKAAEMLAAFRGKLTALLSDVSATMEDYSRIAVKANTVNVLVPASVPPMSLTSGGWVQILLIAEVLLLLGWMAAGIVYGLKQSNPKKKEQSA